MSEHYVTAYKVSPLKKGYEVTAPVSTPLETIWNAEKCWFKPGQRVLVEDDRGNHKVFVKEEQK